MFSAMQRVVARIPRGRVATYGQIARVAGYPGLARQVVWALRAAPNGLPWHRVVGARGRILLLDEARVEQTMRLQREGVQVRQGRIALEAFQVADEKLRKPTGNSGKKPARTRAQTQAPQARAARAPGPVTRRNGQRHRFRSHVQ